MTEALDAIGSDVTVRFDATVRRGDFEVGAQFDLEAGSITAIVGLSLIHI